MKILLLGHKGMLGSDLLLQLSFNHQVVGMDREEIDITSAAECKKAVDKEKPDIIINAAAYTNVDACETNREECFAVNAEAIKNIAEACSKKIFVSFISALIMFLTEKERSLIKKIIRAIR
jgi:dTDP-4-dehydrorhamnose reductase